jgi:hypothetical protein
VTETNAQPADVFTHLVVTSLAPAFLAATGGNMDEARAAVIATINAHNPRSQADLLPIAQIIAFGLAALDSISRSMAEDIPISLALRLRGNATSLNRAAEQCRRALREAPDPHAMAHAVPGVASCLSPELAEAERWIEEAVNAEVARSRQRLGEDQATLGTIEGPSAPAVMGAAIAEADTALKPPALRPTTRDTHHACMTKDAGRHAAWSNAMANVAGELAAENAALPHAASRPGGVRAAALAGAANHLLNGGPIPSPLIQQSARPTAR